jgi:hypothetical protein
MKVKRIILLLVLTLVLALGLAGCNDNKTDPGDTSGTIVNLRSIVVDDIEKLNYISGEPLDISNARLLLEYDNNTADAIPLLESMIPDYDSFTMARAGEYTVNVVYKNCSTSFTVVINDTRSVNLTWNKTPDVTTFVENTPLSLKGGELKMEFASGTPRIIKGIENLVQVSGYNSSVLGEQTITIKYAGFELELDVTIVERSPVSIEVEQMPIRTDYFVGDDFDADGLQIKVNYDNKTSQVFDIEEWDSSEYNISFDSSKESLYSLVRVQYGQLSTTFYVKVRFPAFESIELISTPVSTGIVTPEGKTDPVPINQMVLGDKIDYSTGRVRVHFDDGSMEEYNMSENIIGKKGFVENEVGQFYVRIYFEGNDAQGLDIVAQVHYPTPVQMILDPDSVAVLQSYNFFKGGIIEESKIEYLDYSIKYNNGTIVSGFSINPAEDIYQGNLVCDTAGEKVIVFSFGQNTGVTASVTINVQDVLPVSISIIREPVNKYILQGQDIIVGGGQFEVRYNNGSKRVITFEDPTEDITFTCPDTPDYNNVIGTHTIRVEYAGLYDEYEVEVLDVVVSNITVSNPPDRTQYMQNEALSLNGMKLHVNYSDGSSSNVDVTADMLFENHNLYFNGTDYIVRVPGDNQTITLRYGGLTITYRIDVTPLMVDRLELLRAPKMVYRLGVDTEIDLTNIVVRLYYNHFLPDGSEITDTATYEEIISNPNWILGVVDLTTPGEKSYALFYNLQGEVTSLIFYIQVIEGQLVSIELDRPIEDGMPLNMDLNLEGINLILNYDDDSSRSIPLLKSYTDYDPKDVTPGERTITIRYGGCVTYQTITLSNKRLESVSIDTTTAPRSNFVLGEDLDLSSGRLRREFSDGSHDFIAMSDLTVKISDYDPNIYIGSGVNYVSQTITITYLKYTMNIEVNTYKKLNPQILVSANNVFYGQGSGPQVELTNIIDEFELPEFSYQFYVNDAWQSAIPTQVGSYRIKVIVAGNLYYNGGEFEQAEFFSIIPKNITVTPVNVSKAVGTDDPEFTYTIEEGALLEGDELTGSLARELGEGIGQYKITIGTLGNPNYKISLAEAYLTITAA